VYKSGIIIFCNYSLLCEYTGYSPFEILYGGTVRGPHAVVRESWSEKEPVGNNLIHVLEVRRRLATMQQVVKATLERTQGKQKRLYDIQRSQQKLEVGLKNCVSFATLARE